MKVLVISYLPSLERSRTKKLLDIFIENVKPENTIEHLDLLQDPPDFITPEILQAYVARNYQGKELSDEQKKHMSTFDRMTTQFKTADVVVLAFPMYNFSMPGLVKTYFDSVMLKGETFDAGKKGFVGLMEGKKALVLSSSGGDYSGDNAKYNYLTTLTNAELEFMGFSDIQIVSAQGVDMKSLDTEKIIADARAKVKNIIKTWDL